MIHFKWHQDGGLFGIRYTFEEPGDALPIHAHAMSDAHNVIVLKGMVSVEYGPTEIELYAAGAVVAIRWDQLHTIRAALPDTESLHLHLYGKPMEYALIPDIEQSGSLDGRVSWRE